MSKQADKPTSQELLNEREFNELPITKLSDLLEKHSSFKIIKGTKERFIRDIAANKLHGSVFYHDNEIQKDGKTVKKSKKVTKNYENCPQCSQKKYILQKLPKEQGLKSRKQCDICGYSTEVTV